MIYVIREQRCESKRWIELAQSFIKGEGGFATTDVCSAPRCMLEIKTEIPIKTKEVINSTSYLDVVRRPWIRTLEGS